MELFAKNGFRGTTTRDLAAHAKVNEAIIFRYFTNKTELYRAILEEKVHQGRDEHYKEVEQLAQSSDPGLFWNSLETSFLSEANRTARLCASCCLVLLKVMSWPTCFWEPWQFEIRWCPIWSAR